MIQQSEKVCHPLLPKLKEGYRDNVPTSSRAGQWMIRDAKELENLRRSLKVDTIGIQVNFIPDLWARPILFAMALYNPDHLLHEQVLREWRGLLAMLALQRVMDIDLSAEPVAIPDHSGVDDRTLEFTVALSKYLPTETLSIDTTWTNVYVLLFRGRNAIGITSPSTLVCTATDYYNQLHHVPWFDGRFLMDPTDRLNNSQKEQLASWLEILVDNLRTHPGASPALMDKMIGLLYAFSSDLGGGGDSKSLLDKWSFGMKHGVFRHINRPIESHKAVSAAEVLRYVPDLRHPNSEVRKKAAEALARIGLEARTAVPALIEVIRDTDVQVRSKAIEALGRIGLQAKAAIPATIQALRGDEESEVRRKAVEALSLISAETEAVVPAIIKALSDEDHEVRGEAAEALANMRGEARVAVPALIRTLYDKHIEVRRRAVEALSVIGLEARPAVLHLRRLQNDPNESVRVSVARALRRIMAIGLPLRIEFDGLSGFYLNKRENLRLRITNPNEESVQDISFEIDDTPKYSIDIPPDQRQKTIPELGAGEFRVFEYPISLVEPGFVTLQLKVNGEVYKERALEICAVKDNPYFYGPPVENERNFFGRAAELETSLSNAMRDTGAHTMIVGEQRSGKTSLLSQIRQHLRDPYVPISIPFSGADRADASTALSWLLESIIAKLKTTSILGDVEYSTSLKHMTDFVGKLEKVVKDMNADGQRRWIVLLLDEAHIMGEMDVRFQEVLREAFMGLIQGVRVILACYYDFFDTVNTSGSPLQNIFEFLFLAPLEGDDLMNLIKQPAARFGYCYTQEGVEAIKRVSGGHPYYCQFLCAKSLAEAQNSGTATISAKHVETAAQQVISSDEQRFKMGYWTRMQRDERLFLKKLTHGESLRGTPMWVISKLSKKSVIRKSNGDYAFTADLFRVWTERLIQEELHFR